MPTRWTQAQWDAALAPHRARILVMMEGLGEASAYEVAELLGRSVSSLYRHLDALVAVGLLRKSKVRRGARTQTLYGRGPAMDVPMVDGRTGAGGRQLGRLAAASLAEAAGQVRRLGTVLEGHPLGRGPAGHVGMHVGITWLREPERKRVLRKIEEIMELVRAGQRRRQGERLQVALACFRDISLRELRAAGKAGGGVSAGRRGRRSPSPAARTRFPGRPTSSG